VPITCDLALNPFQFQVRYVVNGETSPTFQVFPQITTLSQFNPSPFNSEQIPFLIPAAAEIFGFNAQAVSGQGGDPVYWRATLRCFQRIAGNDTLIVNPGDPANNLGPFNFVEGDVSAPLNPGQSSALAGFTVFETVNPWLFKPGDLPLDTPVRLAITLSAFADSSFAQSVTDADPSNNELSFWVMRCGEPGVLVA
jgi:hypothetical protein